MWLKKLFKKKETTKTLKGMFDAGFISKELFLRFIIVKKQAKLDKAKKELLEFLKKQKK